MKPLTRNQMEETLVSLSGYDGIVLSKEHVSKIGNSDLFWKVNNILGKLNCIQFTTDERNDFLFGNFK